MGYDGTSSLAVRMWPPLLFSPPRIWILSVALTFEEPILHN